MTADAWERIRTKAEQPPCRTAAAMLRHTDPWAADPWGRCRARWAWWGRLPLRPLAWAYRRGRALAFRLSPGWQRRRAGARLRMAQRMGQRAAAARERGERAAPLYVAQGVALWRQARALAAGHWC